MSIWFFAAVLIASVVSLLYQIFSAIFDFLGNAWQFFKIFFFIVFIIAVVLYIIVFIVYMIKNIKYKRSVIPSALCVLSWLMVLGTLFRLWAINRFFLLTVLILIETIFSYLFLKLGKINAKYLKVPLMLLLGVSIFLPSLWIMGYDLNYIVVTQENNVAYYYCEEILYSYSDEAHLILDENGNIVGATVEKEAITGNYLDRQSGTPLTETYIEGDYLRPDRDAPWIVRDRANASEYNTVWYPVIAPSGDEAYVRHSGLTVYYRGAGAELESMQKDIIAHSWYILCPGFVRSIGKAVFDVCPLWYHANIVQDTSLYL